MSVPESRADCVIHRCPAIGSGVTQCCGRTPFELPATDRMTIEADRVTCGGTEPRQRYDHALGRMVPWAGGTEPEERT